MSNLTLKKNRRRTNCEKDEKSLYKLMNNAVYGKTIEKLRYRIDVRFVSNDKDSLKWFKQTISR